MKCSHCGKTIIFKVKFCPECGQRLINDREKDDDESFDGFSDTQGDFNTPEDDTAYTDAYHTEPETPVVSDGDDKKDKGAKYVPVKGREPDDEEQVERAEANIRLRMAIIGGACVVAVAFIILFIIIFSGPKDTREANTGASDIAQNTSEPEDKTAVAKAAIDAVAEKYYGGEMTYQEAVTALQDYFLDPDAGDYADEKYNEIAAENDFRTALQTADDYFANGDFANAVIAYRAALDKRPTSEEAQTGLDKSVAAYRSTVLDEVQALVADENYDGALEKLTAALVILPEDAELTEKVTQTESDKAAYLKRKHEEEMKGYVAEAEALVKNGKWDDALAYIKSKLKDFPDDEILTKELNYIKNNMPMNLTNVDMFDDKEVKRSGSSIKDRNGKSYDNYVRFAATNRATAKFNLGRAYTTFTATIFVDKDAKPGKEIMVVIYADGEPIYQKGKMTENSSSERIEINVAGVKTLEIVTLNSGTSGGGYLYFAGTSFKRK